MPSSHLDIINCRYEDFFCKVDDVDHYLPTRGLQSSNGVLHLMYALVGLSEGRIPFDVTRQSPDIW
jgi:hypothetical protein